MNTLIRASNFNYLNFVFLFLNLIFCYLTGNVLSHDSSSSHDVIVRRDTVVNDVVDDVIEIVEECFDWMELSSGFRLYEEACQWWHNKNTVYNLQNEKMLQMETECLSVIDMKMYMGGKYVGKIDYISMSWGFDVKIYDCRGKLLGRAKEETSDIFMNSFRVKTVITIYDYNEHKIGYSLRNSEESTTIELQTSPDDSMDVVWMAVRKQHGFRIFCSDPEWTVMRIAHSNIEAGPLADPVFITALVAVEGMKHSGEYDTCTFFAGAGIVLASLIGLALIAAALLVVYKVFFS